MRVGLLFALGGCQTVHGAPEVPAVIVHPTAESRAALAGAVRRAFHGLSVTLADDALTTTSLLIVERAQMRDQNGLPIDGRERVPPEWFELVKSGSNCVLIQQRTAKRLALANTVCAPLRAGARNG